MLFQHSSQTGTGTKRAALEERLEGFAAPILEEVQPKSDTIHLDQRARALPAHHRSNQAVPSRQPQAAQAAETQDKYYKDLTGRCTSRNHLPLSSTGHTDIDADD